MPDRWLIVRAVQSGDAVPAVFIVESNRMRNINDGDMADRGRPDIENMTSPFVNRSIPLSEVFISRSSLLNDHYQTAPASAYRRPFTIFEAANEFFADYQPHNNGVFSMFDDLGQSKGQMPGQATCSYLVIGFHSAAVEDPLTIVDSLRSDRPLTNADLLRACGMTLGSGNPFLKQPAGPSARTLCHGVLRNVPFRRDRCDLDAPSVRLQQLIKTAHPIAIGTHTLDALGAYLHAEQASATPSRAVNQLLGQLLMLIVRDDDVDAQRKAADEIGTNDWIVHPDDTVWELPQHKDQKGDQKTTTPQDPAPPDKHKDKLQVVNDWQLRSTP